MHPKVLQGASSKLPVEDGAVSIDACENIDDESSDTIVDVSETLVSSKPCKQKSVGCDSSQAEPLARDLGS